MRYLTKVMNVQVAIPVAEQFKARVCGQSLAGIPGLNPAGGMGVSMLWALYVVR